MSRLTALAVGGALSIGLHLALPLMFDGGGLRPGRPGASAAWTSPPVRVRLLDSAPSHSSLAPVVPAGAAPAAPPVVDRERDLGPPVSATSAQEVLQPSVDVGENGEGAYLPRSELTLGATPRGVVIIPYPRFIGDQGWYAVQVSLFIDESGTVRRLEFDTPDVPETLQAAVRDAFLNMPFSPGEVDGHAVKSHVRIEISFGTRPAGR